MNSHEALNEWMNINERARALNEIIALYWTEWMEKDRCIESWPACWPTFNGWAGVIFLTLPIPLPVSGFPVNTPREYPLPSTKRWEHLGFKNKTCIGFSTTTTSSWRRSRSFGVWEICRWYPEPKTYSLGFLMWTILVSSNIVVRTTTLYCFPLSLSNLRVRQSSVCMCVVVIVS